MSARRSERGGSDRSGSSARVTAAKSISDASNAALEASSAALEAFCARVQSLDKPMQGFGAIAEARRSAREAFNRMVETAKARSQASHPAARAFDPFKQAGSASVWD